MSELADLEMTRLCAEAMGLPPEESIKAAEHYIRCTFERFDPLHNDAQAMALVKRFRLQVSGWRPQWLVAFNFSEQSDFVGHHTMNDDLNRAIVMCVAQMQAAKATAAAA
jgi:hypothetical protein